MCVASIHDTTRDAGTRWSSRPIRQCQDGRRRRRRSSQQLRPRLVQACHWSIMRMVSTKRVAAPAPNKQIKPRTVVNFTYTFVY